MKTMTCREMGGTCDAVMTANTSQEMMDEGMKHVQASHPEIVEQMKTMSKEENDKWEADFMKSWEMAPETK